jgi:hypothetical protein
VITTGAINNMRSMMSGWYREKFHAEEFAAAEAPAPVIDNFVDTAETIEAPAPRAENGGGDEKERP